MIFRSSFCAAFAWLAITHAGLADSASPGELKPILVIEEHGEGIDPVIKAQLIERVSSGFNRGLMESIGAAVYGQNSRYSNHKPRSVLSNAGLSALNIDRAIEQSLSGNFEFSKIPSGQRWSMSLHFFWTEPKLEFRSIGQQNLGVTMLMLNQLLRFGPGGFRSAIHSSKSVTELADMIVVHAKDLPGGIGDLFKHSKLYEITADAAGAERWAPLYFGLDLGVANSAVTVDVISMLKPGSMFRGVYENKAVAAEYMSYNPVFYGAMENIARLKISRVYTGRGQPSKPRATIRFGERVDRNNIRAIANCNRECYKYIYRVPTIRVKVYPESSAAGIIRQYGRWLFDSVNIFILLQDLAIDLSDPTGPKLALRGTGMPVVIRLNSRVSNNPDDYVTLTETQEYAGFNIYERLGVKKQVSEQLTNDLQKSLAELDRQADESLQRAIQDFTQFLGK
jgi:hypothetical protein